MDVVEGAGDQATAQHLQGWYSAVYDTKQPAPVAVCTVQIAQNATVVWVIATSHVASSPPQITAAVVGDADGAAVAVRVALGGWSGLVDVPMSKPAGPWR
jgi:hypothetical protein